MTTYRNWAKYSKTRWFSFTCQPQVFFRLTFKHSYVRLFGSTVMTLPYAVLT